MRQAAGTFRTAACCITSILVLTFLDRERRLTQDPARDRLSIGLTHRELADLIGTRRESVTVALNALEREGLLRIADHLLVITDEAGTRQIAET